MLTYITLPLLCLTVLCAGYMINSHDFPKIEQKNSVKEFMNLVDKEKLILMTTKYEKDEDLSTLEKKPLFNALINQLEASNELEEILAYLQSKGFSVRFLSDVLNTYLASAKKATQDITGLIDNVKVTLKTEEYLETNPEVTKLLETLNTDEFINKLKKLLAKFKEIIDTYSAAIFERICEFLKNILGDNIPSNIC